MYRKIVLALLRALENRLIKETPNYLFRSNLLKSLINGAKLLQNITYIVIMLINSRCAIQSNRNIIDKK